MQALDVLAAHGLVTAVVTDVLARRSTLCAALLDWLKYISDFSDGLASILCSALLVAPVGPNTFEPPRPSEEGLSLLDGLILRDPRLVRQFAVPLHSVYMRALVDPVFKRGFAMALTRHYRHLSKLCVLGVGRPDTSLFGLR